MAAQPNFINYDRSPVEVMPNGADQPGFSPESLPTGELIDRYFALREAAAATAVPDKRAVAQIQHAVKDRMNLGVVLDNDQLPYGQYDPKAVDRFRQLNGLLRDSYGHIVPRTVLDASEAFIDMVDGMYRAAQEGRKDARLTNAAYGFLVPARASRNRPEDSIETIDPCPSLRYVPDELRVAMYAGLPPFIVDRFNPNADGKRGYMLLAPVFPDMNLRTNEKGAMFFGANQMVNETVRFGHDMLGIRVFGLGASLPAVTHYGENLAVPDVITTTGHGGTIALILKTVQALKERGAVPEEAMQRITVLGVGAIGASIARVVADAYPDAHITLYDPDGKKLGKVADSLRAEERKERPDTVTAASSMSQAVRASDIIISAIANKTGERIDLNKLKGVNLKGKWIIDDSQPWMFDRRQVEALGAYIAWVIGEDQSGMLARRSSSWGIGGTLYGNGEFGCALEVAVVAWALDRTEKYLVSQGASPVEAQSTAAKLIREGLALRQAVTPHDARVFVGLFDQLGITAANPLQAEGRPLQLPGTRQERRRHLLPWLGRAAAVL